jgi:hypothetical protein
LVNHNFFKIPDVCEDSRKNEKAEIEVGEFQKFSWIFAFEKSPFFFQLYSGVLH